MLARYLGMSLNAVGQWEKGERKATGGRRSCWRWLIGMGLVIFCEILGNQTLSWGSKNKA